MNARTPDRLAGQWPAAEAGMEHAPPTSPWTWPFASGAVYALFVFVVPAMTGAAGLVWLVTAGSFAAFVALYADFFVRRHGGLSIRRERSKGAVRRQIFDLGLLAALGFAVTPANVGATTYVVYAAALAPFAFAPRRSFMIFAVLAAALWVELWLMARPDIVVIGAWVTCIIFIVGSGNLFISDRLRQVALVRRAQEEVEEMAKLAERERIARDLHDLLGHTLSVIALKSELASKVADRAPARAVEEIREVERISRDALAEVRAAVEGYRGRGFSGELQQAQRALESAGVRLDADVGQVALSPRQETVLALALREAVTNIVRHARASACRVTLGVDGGDVVLTVHDDGIGGVVREGYGLAGMRERVTAIGGRMTVDQIPFTLPGSQCSVRVQVRSAARRERWSVPGS